MSDSTEDIRRRLVGAMPGIRELAVQEGEQMWSTDQLREEFEVVGFLAPFVSVIRRSDGAKGVMCFTHSPRWYWGFEEEPVEQ